MEEELSKCREELRLKKNLEKENRKLEKEVIQARDGNAREIHEKEEIIKAQTDVMTEQLQVMQMMEADIQKLEDVIHDLDKKLTFENENKATLLDKLRHKEAELDKAKLKRDKTTTDLVMKFSSMRSTYVARSLMSDNFGPGTNMSANTSTMMLSSMSDAKYLDTAKNNNNPNQQIEWNPMVKSVGFRSIDVTEFSNYMVCNILFYPTII